MDPRVEACRAALGSKKPDLAALEALVFTGDDADTSAANDLRRIAQLTPPALDRVGEAVATLRAALDHHADVLTNAEPHTATLATLLEQAIAHVEAAGGACPVCQSELAPTWPDVARARLHDAKLQSAALREGAKAIRAAQSDLVALITGVPAALERSTELGLSTAALTAWRAWATPPHHPRALCDHAESCALELAAELTALRAEAERRHAAITNAWTPIARQLAAFLAIARTVEAERPHLAALTRAKKWLDDAETSLRDERFRPIAERAQHIWSVLRQESNVDLEAVRLDGTGTRRRVALDVAVDGESGVALGVMSQGELNTLALSLFLPRMTLGESPFHFLVIDDPVQAMDPHKVDGLAQVLADVALTRQVIVFTHDNRLYEAIRRLGIQATIFEAQRRARSHVELRPLLDPVTRHLTDARNCLRHQDQLGPRIAARTIPTFCRLALEAACTESYRRRTLAAGAPHLEVEQALEAQQGIHDLLALTLDQNPDTLLAYLNKTRRFGPSAADLLQTLKQTAHHEHRGNLTHLIRATEALARTLRTP